MVIGYVFANKTEHNVHFHQNALAFSADLHFVEPNQKLYFSSIFSRGNTILRCEVGALNRTEPAKVQIRTEG